MQLQKSIGMRTIKTAIAVVITLYVGKTFLISNPFYAVIGTIFAMQNTVKSSFVAGKNRLLGTLIGAFVGFVFAYLTLQSPIFIGIAIIATIYICNCFKLNTSIIIASTITVSILLGITDQDPLTYSVYRTIDTSIGIIIGILVNYFIAQPNYLAQLVKEIETIEQLTKSLVNNILIHQQHELKVFKSELLRLDALFQNYRADTNFDKNPINHHQLRTPIDACHEIYFHAKCIGLLELEQTLLTDDNKRSIIQSVQSTVQSRKLLGFIDPIDPIFNYHIEKMLDELRVLQDSITTLRANMNK